MSALSDCPLHLGGTLVPMLRIPSWALAAAALLAAPHLARADDDGAYEIDRPGEVQNPFGLPVGRAQWINYVVAANPAGREAEDLGEGGSAVFWQSDLRCGIVPLLEGQIALGSFLNAIDKGGDGDDRGVSRGRAFARRLRARFLGPLAA